MRSLMASIMIATLSLGVPALVQAQGASPQPETQQSPAQEAPAQSDTVIRAVQVVDIKQLQPEVRAKVDEIVAQTSEEELKSLRKSIDETPETASALKAKGLNSSHVIAINIADGVLTMIAKTA